MGSSQAVAREWLQGVMAFPPSHSRHIPEATCPQWGQSHALWGRHSLGGASDAPLGGQGWPQWGHTVAVSPPKGPPPRAQPPGHGPPSQAAPGKATSPPPGSLLGTAGAREVCTRVSPTAVTRPGGICATVLTAEVHTPKCTPHPETSPAAALPRAAPQHPGCRAPLTPSCPLYQTGRKGCVSMQKGHPTAVSAGPSSAGSPCGAQDTPQHQKRGGTEMEGDSHPRQGGTRTAAVLPAKLAGGGQGAPACPCPRASPMPDPPAPGGTHLPWANTVLSTLLSQRPCPAMKWASMDMKHLRSLGIVPLGEL